MEICVNYQPSLLSDTAELVCAYINGIDPGELTGEGPCCVPASEIAQIMEQVCSSLDREDGKLKFYFQRFQLTGELADEYRTTCVCAYLVNSTSGLEISSLEECREKLHTSIVGTHRPYRIQALTSYFFDCDLSTEYVSISQELSKFNIPDDLRLRLVEVLSDYHYHVEQICDILEPLARRFRERMEPWIEKMQLKIRQWQDDLATQEGVERFLSRMNAKFDNLERIVINFKVFYPTVSTYSCKYKGENRDLYCILGMDFQLVNQEQKTLSLQDQSALRLLSSMDRIEMLRAMSGKAMTQKELSSALKINPGTVFRDVNGLLAARLLVLTLDDSNRRYTTDLDYLEKVVANMIQYIRNGM